MSESVFRLGGPINRGLYGFDVIRGEINAEGGIVRVDFSLVWMLTNSLCAIMAGWGFNFQVHGNVDDICFCANVDHVGERKVRLRARGAPCLVCKR